MDINDIRVGMKIQAFGDLGINSKFIKTNDVGIVVRIEKFSGDILAKWNNPNTKCKDSCWWIYSGHVIPYFKKLKSWELLKLAEDGVIKQNSLYRDQEGSVMIYTGKSFKVYETEFDCKYVGLCVGDEWEFVGIAEDDQESIDKLRYEGVGE